MSHEELTSALAKLNEKEAALTRWVAEHRDAIDSRAHLKEGIQRTYWMYGQLIAIRDAIKLIQAEVSGGESDYDKQRVS